MSAPHCDACARSEKAAGLMAEWRARRPGQAWLYQIEMKERGWAALYNGAPASRGHEVLLWENPALCAVALRWDGRLDRLSERV